MVFGCEQEPKKSFEGTGAYVPQNATPTVGTIDYSTGTDNALYLRVLALEKANTLLERCLGEMVGGIIHTHKVDSINNVIETANGNFIFNWSSSGDCKEWRDIYYERETR